MLERVPVSPFIAVPREGNAPHEQVSAVRIDPCGDNRERLGLAERSADS